jgi:TonB family protein
MRTRDVTIPMALWICAAICAHFFFGSGGLVVAKVHDDRAEFWKLAKEASSLAKQGEQTFEVSLSEPGEESPEEPAPPPPKPQETPPAPPPAVPTTPPPPPEKPKEPPKVVVVEKKKDDAKPLVLPEDPLKDRRIAVRQHAKADQEDNPTAKFIADQANHVKEETRATQTSTDRDDENPTPGANHRSAEQAPGDSDKTRIADSDVHKGSKDRAPGERGTDIDMQEEPKLPKPSPIPSTVVATLLPPPTAPQQHASSEPRPATPQASPTAPPAPAQGGATPPSPEVEDAANGSWTFNPARQGGASGVTRQAVAGNPQPNLPGGRMWTLPGLGQAAAPGQLNTNLNVQQVAAIVGSDNLRKLREADGERRRSEHRGSWAQSNFERWRSAIENYIAGVREGNQTALNTAAVPFATYLNGMHERIHPIFAEAFLGPLDSLPPSHPMNDQSLVTRLEIVLTREGHLKRMGVVKASGVTAFDIAALDSVDRAQPFGPAPAAIVSPDGNVYLHWEFHRNEVFACSTQGARPFILAAPPGGPPSQPPAPGPAPGPGKERGVQPTSPNDAREGQAPQRRTQSGV